MRSNHPLTSLYLGKVTPLQSRLWSRGGVQVQLYSSKTSALEGGEWSAARSGLYLPPGKTRYPLYRWLGRPQGRSGRTENLAPTEIRFPDRPARSQSLYLLIYPANLRGIAFHNYSTTVAYTWHFNP